MLPHLVNHAPTEAVRSLLARLHQLMGWGAIYDVFDAVLDHSDLLVAYPDDAQRQFAELGPPSCSPLAEAATMPPPFIGAWLSS